MYYPVYPLIRISINVKSHHDHGKSHKGKHPIGAGLQFRELVHYHHGGMYGGTRADMAAWSSTLQEERVALGLA